ncbi:MAG: hypothetical protein VYA51_00420 [Planctomycetota bacterium]|nr:hypothetical protein [Planctomycetota bacterium]
MSEQFPAGDGGVDAGVEGEQSKPLAASRGGRKRRALALVVGLLLASVVFELGSALVITTELLPARVPSYSMTASAAGFWGDLSETFGAWHPPNTRYLHQKACFSVFYESNAHGARDVARRREHDGPRVVVLGDSFMEGYGVDAEARLSNVLEGATGIPHLNFGTSGNAGSTHAFALYSTFASGFAHDAVVASILPENDFDDDVPKPDRYQPYWSGSYPDYELEFSLPSAGDSPFRCSTGQAGFDFGRALREFTYSTNLLDYLYSAFKQGRQGRKFDGASSAPDSRFFRFTSAEFDRLRYSYEQLAAAASPRPVVLFTIPRHADFAAFRARGESPLDAALADWAAGIENVHFVPLLPAMAARFGDDLDAQFLSCDAHWSPAGHAAAAEAVRAAYGQVLYGN